jgi:putative transposase
MRRRSLGILVWEKPQKLVTFLEFLVLFVIPALWRGIVGRAWKRPTSYSLSTGAVLDLCHSKRDLVLENALLRQQLVVLRRQVNRPQLNNTDRTLMVLLAGRLRTWKSALLIVQPDTLLRWHRAGFRLFWKRKSGTISSDPRLPAETRDLIQQMALENRLWGAERIRGELLKLDIKVCKRTIQKYMRQARKPGPADRKPNQNWLTFVHNHVHQIWACDFLPVYDLFFRPLFVFFIIELGTRRVVHFGVTRSPTDEWTAQQLREATPFGETPRFLIRDNDSKYAEKFNCVAVSSGIKVLRTPYKAPRANAYCERLLGSIRRECLDYVLILGERHLHGVVREYVRYYNSARPHQGIGQSIPEVAHQSAEVEEKIRQIEEGPPGVDRANGKVISLPVLGGLHHDYRRVA